MSLRGVIVHGHAKKGNQTKRALSSIGYHGTVTSDVKRSALQRGDLLGDQS